MRILINLSKVCLLLHRRFQLIRRQNIAETHCAPKILFIMQKYFCKTRQLNFKESSPSFLTYQDCNLRLSLQKLQNFRHPNFVFFSSKKTFLHEIKNSFAKKRFFIIIAANTKNKACKYPNV